MGALVETSLASGRDILAGISEYVRQHSPWIIYTYPHDISTPPPSWLQHWQCDGIIVRLHNVKVAQALTDQKTPVVDVLGVYGRGRYPLVHTDNQAIGRMAADHFHERGFVEYAFVGLGDENWSIERYDAFAARVAELKGSCSRLMIEAREEKASSHTQRIAHIQNWLRTLQLPLAIFVSNDSQAIIVRDAATHAGLVVGRDIAVLGVDNDQTFCEIPTPSLSSIDADHKRVGYEAAALLDAMMNGQPAPAQPVLVPPRGVVVRESTGFLAVPDDALQAAVHFIRNRATGGISVADVVAASHASRSVLQRRFRTHLGQTIHEFILNEKTRRAIHLIRDTNESIEDIARATGFEYTQSLNKALQRLFGRSAREYRSKQLHLNSADGPHADQESA